MQVDSMERTNVASREAAWVGAAQAGDRQAFERLYRAHCDRIHALCWRLCGGDPVLAEDLVQEAWLKLYGRPGRDPSKSLFFTAIRNLFIDQYRRNKLVVFEPFDEEQTPRDDELFPAPIAMEDLEPALAALRPEEREAIFLNSVEGYTAQEIADLTRRPRGTVLSLMQRGKKKMARILRGMWDDGREQNL